MFDTPPDPIAFTLGPLTIGWYGLMYAIGLAVVYVVLVWLAKRAGEDPDVVNNGIIIVAVAALVGGRLYHVIDEWERYAADPIRIILPPYSGLGVYGGIITGTLAAFWYARRRGVSFPRWADIVAPSLFVMQAIGRWGNYFNQALYGPPTTLPWGIPIDCAHRLEAYACAVVPETARFHPLFLYESISGLLGAVVLVWLGFRLRDRLVPGDLFLLFAIWYGVTRFALETLREDNWLFFGIPVAQMVSIAFIAAGVIGLIVRHRKDQSWYDPAAFPEVATWGALSWVAEDDEDDRDATAERIDEPWHHAGDLTEGRRGDRTPADLGIGPAADDDDDGSDPASPPPDPATTSERGDRPTPA
jgi:phosphatidylglycerol---prolipoprotein diacylglyceryl transferase